MAQWLGPCGVRLAPLADALKSLIPGHAMVHADETPVALLARGRGKTKKACVWVYRTTNFVARRAVWLDFCASRTGEHPRRVLAHARHKLFEAHQFNGSEIAGQAVTLIAKLYEIERDARELDPEARRLLRQARSKLIVQDLQAWLTTERPLLAQADTTAKAIGCTLSNWRALTRFLDDGSVPVDNNNAENSVRPLAGGRKKWLFVGSQQAGEHAAVVMA